jgi:hypothetical protein
MRLLGYV